MKINAVKTVQVEAKTLKIYMKVRDSFCATLTDQNGEEIYSWEDDYVPQFMPGEHFGDYLILDIDIDTGKILNWTKLSQEDLEMEIKVKEK